MYAGFGVFSSIPVLQLIFYSNQNLHNTGFIDFSHVGFYYYAMGVTFN
jgi:hypothetical protein